MFVNISEILSHPSAKEDYKVRPDFNKLTLRRVSYKVSHVEPFVLHVSKEGSSYHIAGETTVRLIMPCDRCLSDVEKTFPIHIDRRVDMDKKQDGDYDADEFSFIDGCMLDADKLVIDEIVVALPTKILCKEDCKGLCPTCGQNLNEGTCGCTNENPDPRMAAIADIFRNYNE